MVSDQSASAVGIAGKAFGLRHTGHIAEQEASLQFGPEERAAAAHYEYSRESPSIQRYVAQRRAGDSLGFPKRWQALGQLFTGCHHFPAKPWAAIPLKERRKLGEAHTKFLKAFNENRAVVFAAVSAYGPTRPLMKRRFEDLDQGEPDPLRATILIAPTADPRAVVQAFEQWVGSLGLAERKGSRPGRAASTIDPLNWLLAMRLKYHMQNLQETQQFLKNLRGKGIPAYRDFKALNRACQQACAWFQQELELPEEQPLRFASSWKAYDKTNPAVIAVALGCASALPQ